MTARTIDLRLWPTRGEIYVLERYLELIEEHIELSRKEAERAKAAGEKELSFHSSDEDWSDPSSDAWAELDLIQQEHEIEVDFIQPRMLRGPCLVVLYSVYEAAVRRAADAIQRQKGKDQSIIGFICFLETGRARGSFLQKIEKYYSSVLQFDLLASTEHREKLKLLSDLRNIIAHSNGYLGHLDKKKKKKYAESLCHSGVTEEYHCLVVSGGLLQELFIVVKEELESLVKRYRQWDDSYEQGSDPA